MIIRNKQIDALSKDVEADFEAEIVNFLQTDYPEIVRDLAPDVLRLMVRGGIARARGCGLTWRYSISVFVSLMFMFAPNFDEHPAIHARLTNPVALPDELIDSAIEKTTSMEWTEARYIYDKSAWGVAAEFLPDDWRPKWTPEKQ
jgi:hypothetical protein